MKTLQALAMIAAGLATGCGGSDDSKRIYKFAQGEYAVSEVRFTKDECKYDSMPTPLKIAIDAETGIAKVTNFAGLPAGPSGGNKFALTGEETLDHTAQLVSQDCKEHLSTRFEVNLTADNKFKGTVTIGSTVAGGNACTEPNLGYPVPCDSVATFVAAIVPAAP